MIVRSKDGTLIFVDSFSAPAARGSLLVIHGLGEHSGRYRELVTHARELGMSVHLLDLRGHGRSQGTRGHFNSIAELHQDVDAWISHLVDTGAFSPGKPCYLLGHSLGGLVALTYLGQYVARPLFPDFTGLCLSAPAIGLRPGPLPIVEELLAKQLPPFLRSLQVPTGLRPEDFTHDEAEILRYRADPLVHSWITPAAYLAMKAAMASLARLPARIDLPLLFLLSGKDKVVHTDAALSFARKVGIAHSGKVEVRIFRTFFHEPFHETKRERAYLELKKWMLKCRPTTRLKKNSSRSSGKKATGRAISPSLRGKKAASTST